MVLSPAKPEAFHRLHHQHHGCSRRQEQLLSVQLHVGGHMWGKKSTCTGGEISFKLFTVLCVVAVKPDPPVDVQLSLSAKSLWVSWSPPPTWGNMDILPLKYHIKYQWTSRGIHKSVTVSSFNHTCSLRGTPSNIFLKKSHCGNLLSSTFEITHKVFLFNTWSQDAHSLKLYPCSPQAGSVWEHQGQPQGTDPGEILPVPGVCKRAAGSGRVQQLELSCENHFTQEKSVENRLLVWPRKPGVTPQSHW